MPVSQSRSCPIFSRSSRMNFGVAMRMHPIEPGRSTYFPQERCPIDSKRKALARKMRTVSDRSRSVAAELFRTVSFYAILPGKIRDPIGYSSRIFRAVPTQPPRRNPCRTTMPGRPGLSRRSLIAGALGLTAATAGGGLLSGCSGSSNASGAVPPAPARPPPSVTLGPKLATVQYPEGYVGPVARELKPITTEKVTFKIVVTAGRDDRRLEDQRLHQVAGAEDQHPHRVEPGRRHRRRHHDQGERDDRGRRHPGRVHGHRTSPGRSCTCTASRACSPTSASTSTGTR